MERFELLQYTNNTQTLMVKQQQQLRVLCDINIHISPHLAVR